MTKKLQQSRTISVGDTEYVSVNYTKILADDELLTGTPTVVEVATSDLTLASKAVSTAEYNESITGNVVKVGKAVRFSIAGGTAANSPYLVTVTVTTDATVARTIVRNVEVTFE